MKTFLCRTPKFGLFFADVFLALQITPAVAADSGSGTLVITEKGGIPFSVTFKDVYAFRAETPGKTQVTVVILSESPMDKKAMTAALRKERKVGALSMVPSLNMTYAKLEIHEDGEGKIEKFTIVKTGASYSGSGRDSDVKVNTAKRVEGSFSYNEPHFGDQLNSCDVDVADGKVVSRKVTIMND